MKTHRKIGKALGIIGLLAVGMNLPATAHSAEIQKGKSIVFERSDFTTPKAETPDEVEATKMWAIYSVDSPRPTEVWSVQAMSTSTENGLKNRLCSTDSGYGGVVSATWRCEVPDGMVISGFTWRVARIFLGGAPRPKGDDSIAWEYSTDGVRWHPFYERENRAEAETTFVTINGLSRSVELPRAESRQLFVRLVSIEGPIAEDAGYVAVVTNLGPDGGESRQSSITVKALVLR